MEEDAERRRRGGVKDLHRDTWMKRRELRKWSERRMTGGGEKKGLELRTALEDEERVVTN